MERTQWRRPVEAGGMAITDALEAIRFMDHRWPQLKGQCFSRAHSACLAALDGRVDADAARLRFAEAVEEASLQTPH
ncbi:DUF982 domain-containing protein [Rhizobium helianthi]|uniref:DUF982 domain-containing protein n=1 Tax=Rhizobium helianthi TaxID=1132695 RepID=A0ABW4LZE9_9HYPH